MVLQVIIAGNCKVIIFIVVKNCIFIFTGLGPSNSGRQSTVAEGRAQNCENAGIGIDGVDFEELSVNILQGVVFACCYA